MEGRESSEGARDLTSSSIDREEKADGSESCSASDSVPSSSSDANTSVSVAKSVQDDPISSTSDSVSVPEIGVVDTASNKYPVAESDFFTAELTMTSISTEGIFENVEDIANDLESLLGEASHEFSSPFKLVSVVATGDVNERVNVESRSEERVINTHRESSDVKNQCMGNNDVSVQNNVEVCASSSEERLNTSREVPTHNETSFDSKQIIEIEQSPKNVETNTLRENIIAECNICDVKMESGVVGVALDQSSEQVEEMIKDSISSDSLIKSDIKNDFSLNSQSKVAVAVDQYSLNENIQLNESDTVSSEDCFYNKETDCLTRVVQQNVPECVTSCIASYPKQCDQIVSESSEKVEVLVRDASSTTGLQVEQSATIEQLASCIGDDLSNKKQVKGELTISSCEKSTARDVLRDCDESSNISSQINENEDIEPQKQKCLDDKLVVTKESLEVVQNEVIKSDNVEHCNNELENLPVTSNYEKSVEYSENEEQKVDSLFIMNTSAECIQISTCDDPNEDSTKDILQIMKHSTEVIQISKNLDELDDDDDENELTRQRDLNLLQVAEHLKNTPQEDVSDLVIGHNEQNPEDDTCDVTQLKKSSLDFNEENSFEISVICPKVDQIVEQVSQFKREESEVTTSVIDEVEIHLLEKDMKIQLGEEEASQSENNPCASTNIDNSIGKWESINSNLMGDSKVSDFLIFDKIESSVKQIDHLPSLKAPEVEVAGDFSDEQVALMEAYNNIQSQKIGEPKKLGNTLDKSVGETVDYSIIVEENSTDLPSFPTDENEKVQEDFQIDVNLLQSAETLGDVSVTSEVLLEKRLDDGNVVNAVNLNEEVCEQSRSQDVSTDLFQDNEESLSEDQTCGVSVQCCTHEVSLDESEGGCISEQSTFQGFSGEILEQRFRSDDGKFFGFKSSFELISNTNEEQAIQNHDAVEDKLKSEIGSVSVDSTLERERDEVMTRSNVDEDCEEMKPDFDGLSQNMDAFSFDELPQGSDVADFFDRDLVVENPGDVLKSEMNLEDLSQMEETVACSVTSPTEHFDNLQSLIIERNDNTEKIENARNYAEETGGNDRETDVFTEVEGTEDIEETIENTENVKEIDNVNENVEEIKDLMGDNEKSSTVCEETQVSETRFHEGGDDGRRVTEECKKMEENVDYGQATDQRTEVQITDADVQITEEVVKVELGREMFERGEEIECVQDIPIIDDARYIKEMEEACKNIEALGDLGDNVQDENYGKSENEETKIVEYVENEENEHVEEKELELKVTEETELRLGSVEESWHESKEVMETTEDISDNITECELKGVEDTCDIVRAAPALAISDLLETRGAIEETKYVGEDLELTENMREALSNNEKSPKIMRQDTVEIERSTEAEGSDSMICDLDETLSLITESFEDLVRGEVSVCSPPILSDPVEYLQSDNFVEEVEMVEDNEKQSGKQIPFDCALDMEKVVETLSSLGKNENDTSVELSLDESKTTAEKTIEIICARVKMDESKENNINVEGELQENEGSPELLMAAVQNHSSQFIEICKSSPQEDVDECVQENPIRLEQTGEIKTLLRVDSGQKETPKMEDDFKRSDKSELKFDESERYIEDVPPRELRSVTKSPQTSTRMEDMLISNKQQESNEEKVENLDQIIDGYSTSVHVDEEVFKTNEKPVDESELPKIKMQSSQVCDNATSVERRQIELVLEDEDVNDFEKDEKNEVTVHHVVDEKLKEAEEDEMSLAPRLSIAEGTLICGGEQVSSIPEGSELENRENVRDNEKNSADIRLEEDERCSSIEFPVDHCSEGQEINDEERNVFGGPFVISDVRHISEDSFQEAERLRADPIVLSEDSMSEDVNRDYSDGEINKLGGINIETIEIDDDTDSKSHANDSGDSPVRGLNIREENDNARDVTSDVYVGVAEDEVNSTDIKRKKGNRSKNSSFKRRRGAGKRSGIGRGNEHDIEIQKMEITTSTSSNQTSDVRPRRSTGKRSSVDVGAGDLTNSLSVKYQEPNSSGAVGDAQVTSSNSDTPQRKYVGEDVLFKGSLGQKSDGFQSTDNHKKFDSMDEIMEEVDPMLLLRDVEPNELSSVEDIDQSLLPQGSGVDDNSQSMLIFETGVGVDQNILNFQESNSELDLELPDLEMPQAIQAEDSGADNSSIDENIIEQMELKMEEEKPISDMDMGVGQGENEVPKDFLDKTRPLTDDGLYVKVVSDEIEDAIKHIECKEGEDNDIVEVSEDPLKPDELIDELLKVEEAKGSVKCESLPLAYQNKSVRSNEPLFSPGNDLEVCNVVKGNEHSSVKIGMKNVKVTRVTTYKHQAGSRGVTSLSEDEKHQKGFSSEEKTVSKMKVPLVINVDTYAPLLLEDSAQKLKIAVSESSNYSSKISTSKDLKMTITKRKIDEVHAGTSVKKTKPEDTHSILKIYDPKDAEVFQRSQGMKEGSVVPKLIIKPVVKSQQEPEQKIPSITIKAIVDRDNQHSPKIRNASPKHSPKLGKTASPRKLTIKSIQKIEDVQQMSSPKSLKIQSLNIDDEDDDDDVQIIEPPMCSPKVIIKPIKTPLEMEGTGHNTRSSARAAAHVRSPEVSSYDMLSPTPKVTIKPVVRQDEHKLGRNDAREDCTPRRRVTIKPLVKPIDEGRCRYEQRIQKKSFDQEVMAVDLQHSPRITFKSVGKPLTGDDARTSRKEGSKRTSPESEPFGHSPRLVIKPIQRPYEEESPEYTYGRRNTTRLTTRSNEDAKHESSMGSPKITIKPIVRPPDEDSDCELIDYDDQIKQERIVLKINKNTVAKDSRKREAADDSERLTKIKVKLSKEGGRARIVPESQRQVRLKRGLDTGSVQENDPKRTKFYGKGDVRGVYTDMLTDPLESIPVFEIATNSGTALKAAPPVTAPRKRGRPRKIPLEVREEFKENKDDAVVAVLEVQEETTLSGRPKRSCRGRATRGTFAVKTRKPRGGGRGRGRGRGSRGRGARGARVS